MESNEVKQEETDPSGLHNCENDASVSSREESVVIVQGSDGDGSLEGLDPSLAKYVRQLLQELDGQQSVIIVNQRDDESGQTQSYQVNFQPEMELIQENNVHSSFTTHACTTSQMWSASREVTTSTNVVTTTLASETAGVSVHLKEVSKARKPQGVTSTISDDLRQQELVSSTSYGNKLFIQNSSVAPQSKEEEDIIDSVKSTEPQDVASVAAEHLLNIAHQLVGKSDSVSKQKSPNPRGATSMQSSSSIKGLSPASKGQPESSVITMYLSSPSELKSKIETLKDNSPIVILQAQNNNSPSLTKDEQHGLDSTADFITTSSQSANDADGVGGSSRSHIQSTKCNNDPTTTQCGNSSSMNLTKSPYPVAEELVVAETGSIATTTNSTKSNTEVTASNRTSAAESGLLEVTVTESGVTSSDTTMTTVISSPSPGSSVGAPDKDDSVVYRCQECGYSSHNKHYYKQHVDLVHNQLRPYKCPHCDYAGKRRHALLEHMVVHSNNRPFTCGHCNASFRKKGHLTNHIKLHTSQRLVHCGVCNIQLPDSEAFQHHLRKIHRTDKLYRCKLCDHTVVDREAMLKHFKTHEKESIAALSIADSHNDKSSSELEEYQNDPKDKPHKSDAVYVKVPAEKGVKKPVVTEISSPISAAQKSVVSRPNLVCSECRFVCSDQAVMQRHMWVHIKQTASGFVFANSSGQIASDISAKENSSSVGVLKRNVDSGQKFLPNDVFYQCTSCAYTSKDNSAFIKHMLAHKTQEKHQREVVELKGQPHVQRGQQTDGPSLKSVGVYSTEVSSSTAAQMNVDKDADGADSSNSVPFVYDKFAGRFRCLICNYHCEFQRTIKAHIWKHSGHQGIEYPTFDNSGNATSMSSSVVVEAKTPLQYHSDSLNVAPAPANEKGASVVVPHSCSPTESGALPVLKTTSGNMVHLMPVDPTKDHFNPGELIQIKDNKVIIPEEMKQEPSVSKLLQSRIVFNKGDGSRIVDASSAKENIIKTVPDTTAAMDSKIKNGKGILLSADNANQKKGVLCDGRDVETNAASKETLKGSQSSVPVPQQLFGQDSSVSVEPNVVVEVVETVPTGSSLTGLKSQQGSPRVSDLESSGGDMKLEEIRTRNALRSQDNLITKPEAKTDSDGSTTKKSDSASSSSSVKQSDGQVMQSTTTLRCPFCDCKISDDFNAHLMSCTAKNKNVREVGEEGTEVVKSGLDLLPDAESASYTAKDDASQSQQGEDTDSTESSDETSAGEAANGEKKAGICSSLLAVIEQLRERSRSESGEEDKLAIRAPTTNKKPVQQGGRKKRGNAAAVDAATSISLETLDDLKNIEKLAGSGSAGGDKYRCMLCHYTSERIYNMKLHMKTHRQKKPSECSLCDFSSTSQEALQQHMLKHCKVRTYACKFCPQSFNHKSTLRAHLRAHREQEPFLCAYCVFETSNADEYREHMQVHSGCSTRLRCPGCDVVLSSKDELTTHLLACKGKKANQPAIVATGEAKSGSRNTSSGGISTASGNISVGKSDETCRLEIDDRGVGRAAAATLPAASWQHACVVRGCRFTSPSLKELQDHLSVHCNPTLLLCNLCDFKALHSRSLKSHMKRHANDQRYVQQPLEQYKCNLCGYVCHHLPSLKSHMWRHASDQSYSYEFTNDVINAAIDHDTRVDASGGGREKPDDPELLDQVINSERKILEGELSKCRREDGARPVCWVTFRCCSCGFETINKAKLNVHMRSHSELIQQAQALDIVPSRQRKRFGGEVDRSFVPAGKVFKMEN